jgi:putative DNA primase/helicase
VSPTVGALLRALNDRGLQRTGAGWMARCPSHDDQRASLSIAEGGDGRVLMRCHAGCETADVVAALGLTMADLMPPTRENGRHVEAEYDYWDENGDLLFQVVRFAPKDFRQRRPDGSGGWTWGLGDVSRILYRLPELMVASEAPVFVVEGEKDADKLTGLGLLATTNPGGAGKWRPEYSEALRDRTVVIIPDNDEPGRRHAEQVAASLENVAAAVTVLTLAHLPPKGDVSDWLSVGGTAAELLAMATRALHDMPVASREPGSDDDDHTVVLVVEGLPANDVSSRYEDDSAQERWESPVPFARHQVPAFPVDALPSSLREFVAAVAEDTQTPPDMTALLVLAVVATCVQRRTAVRVSASYWEPLSLFVLAVAESGERKSAVMSQAARPLHAWEREALDKLGAEIEAARADRRALEKRRDAMEDKAARAIKTEEAAAARKEMREIVEQLAKETVPDYPRLLADDITPEALARLMATQAERMAVLSAEGGIFETMAGRYNNGVVNIDVFLKGHAGDALRVDRRNALPLLMDHPALTLGLAVQRDVVVGLTGKAGFRGRGLMARFLYAVPPSLVGRRKTAVATVPASIRKTYEDVIARLLERELEDVRHLLYGRARPGLEMLTLSPAADEVRIAFAASIEGRLGPGGDLHHIADLGAKACGAAVRIAGILHAVTCAEAGEDVAGEIDANLMTSAVRIAGQYLVPHALAAFADAGADPALDATRAALECILGRRWSRFSTRELYDALRGQVRFSKVAAVSATLDDLKERGYVRRAQGRPHPGAGRKPSPVWEVYPHASMTPSQNAQNTFNAVRAMGSKDSADSTDRPSTGEDGPDLVQTLRAGS